MVCYWFLYQESFFPVGNQQNGMWNLEDLSDYLFSSFLSFFCLCSLWQLTMATLLGIFWSKTQPIRKLTEEPTKLYGIHCFWLLTLVLKRALKKVGGAISGEKSDLVLSPSPQKQVEGIFKEISENSNIILSCRTGKCCVRRARPGRRTMYYYSVGDQAWPWTGNNGICTASPYRSLHSLYM
jgi:hypothetical protein